MRGLGQVVGVEDIAEPGVDPRVEEPFALGGRLLEVEPGAEEAAGAGHDAHAGLRVVAEPLVGLD